LSWLGAARACVICPELRPKRIFVFALRIAELRVAFGDSLEAFGVRVVPASANVEHRGAKGMPVSLRAERARVLGVPVSGQVGGVSSVYFFAELPGEVINKGRGH